MKERDSRRGFTLVETLMAVLVAALVALAIAVGVGAAYRVYEKAVAISESQLLSSTLTQAVTDQLHYARDIDDAGGQVSFTSDTFGPAVTFGETEGRLTLGGLELVGSGAYSTGTGQSKRAELQVTWDGARFHAHLEIFLGEQSLKALDFTVRPLSPQPET